MKIKVFTPEDQKLFRKIIEVIGERDKNLRELIDKGLDSEAAIISWLKRIGAYEQYQAIKNEQISD